MGGRRRDTRVGLVPLNTDREREREKGGFSHSCCTALRSAAVARCARQMALWHFSCRRARRRHLKSADVNGEPGRRQMMEFTDKSALGV